MKILTFLYYFFITVVVQSDVSKLPANITPMEIITITPEHYPFLLKQIPQLPKQLDIIGTLPSDENINLCVVGSRENSLYGHEACEHLIGGLRGYPITIVSGLANGIDSIAHEAALKVGLKTVAWPGSGLILDVIYPPTKKPLAEKILASGGCLMSPFKKEQEGAPWTFPIRNRLMAGMSKATLVIEAVRGSGSLITTDYALEFNRDVLAVPGSIFSDLSYGPHMLIERGATPVMSSQDILRALGFEVEDASGDANDTDTDTKVKKEKSKPDNNKNKQLSIIELSLSPEEKKIVDVIRNESLSSSDIIEKTHMTSALFNMFASELELKGIITERNGVYRMCR